MDIYQSSLSTGATGQHNPSPAKTGQGSLSCSVSVQTTETCLSLCANCIDMQKVLEQASTITSHAVDVCSNDTPHNSPPSPPSTHPTTSGVFDCQKWLTTFQGDMSKVVGLHKHMVDQCVRLGERVGALQLEVKRNQELLCVKEDELAEITREKEEIDATADQKRVELVDKHHSEMRAMESNILKLKNELGNSQKEMKQLHGSKIELLTMLSEKSESLLEWTCVSVYPSSHLIPSLCIPHPISSHLCVSLIPSHPISVYPSSHLIPSLCIPHPISPHLCVSLIPSLCIPHPISSHLCVSTVS